MQGTSMRYSFDAASIPTAKKAQFYSMLGTRGIWHGGWKAVTTHPSVSGWSHFEQDTWELYHTQVDRSELHDLAGEQPDKLAEMIGLWFYEAGVNHAFPLDDRSPVEIFLTPRPQLAPPRDRYVYRPSASEVPESVAVNVRNRSYSIGAVVDVAEQGAQGVLFSHGSRFGGHALYIKDNRLHYVYNFVGITEQHVVATEDVPTGENLRRSARATSRPSPASSPSPARASMSDATAANPSLTTTRPPALGVHGGHRPPRRDRCFR